MQLINQFEGKLKSLVFLVILLVVVTVGVFLYPDIPGLNTMTSKNDQSAPAKSPEQAGPAATSGDSGITIKLSYGLDRAEIEKTISVLDDEQRKAILADEESFRNFVQNESANKSLLAAAHANNIDTDERNLYIVQRGAENIVREIYMRKLLATKMPADFPTDEQISEFYDKNKDSFALEERVPVWQIFLPIEDSTDQKEWELLKKQAETIITDINNDKMDFGTAARKYSKPLNSKYTDGYMGIVKVSDIKPEVKATLLSTEPGKISVPVKTDDGIHIIKRGEVIPKQQVKLDEVKPQIINTLKSQLVNQLKVAVFKQASETYPIDLDNKSIEEWRLKIRTSKVSEKSPE